VFYVDDDDPTSADAVRETGQTLVVGPRILLSSTWNECVRHAHHDVFMHCNDDIYFRSGEWDKYVLRVFDRYEDKIVFVHGDDGHWGAGFGSHGFLHRRWVETVGYFVPPYFACDWNDTWLNDVANALGRRVYLPNVKTEHLHPAFGTRPLDQTDRDRMENGGRDNVDALYRNLAAERAIDVAKLRAEMR
jgi:glycosyl transferase/beta-hydroxylase protein BlmF